MKRQSDDKEKKSAAEYEQELCKDKDAGEWFRLVAQEGDGCRDVIQCTTSVCDKYFINCHSMYFLPLVLYSFLFSIL